MAQYYARLTRIFTVSESHLYNGYAWYKLFNLSKAYNKALSAGDLQARQSLGVGRGGRFPLPWL